MIRIEFPATRLFLEACFESVVRVVFCIFFFCGVVRLSPSGVSATLERCHNMASLMLRNNFKGL